MTKYSNDITKQLSEKLNTCLLDAKVPETVVKCLVDKGITKRAAVADLAETKTGIVDIVGRAAGLDPNDHVQCQPLKTAWRNAEAQTKAELEAEAKGEDLHKEAVMGSEQRQRWDDQAKCHFNFCWPAHWLSTSSLL